MSHKGVFFLITVLRVKENLKKKQWEILSPKETDLYNYATFKWFFKTDIILYFATQQLNVFISNTLISQQFHIVLGASIYYQQ